MIIGRSKIYCWPLANHESPVFVMSIAVMFLREELEAAVRIARQRGVPVAVHATYHEAVKWAVRAGAHSIEHGYILVEPGKLADLIVVAGDPLEDIHQLRHLLLVIKDGRVVVDKRRASG